MGRFVLNSMNLTLNELYLQQKLMLNSLRRIRIYLVSREWTAFGCTVHMISLMNLIDEESADIEKSLINRNNEFHLVKRRKQKHE